MAFMGMFMAFLAVVLVILGISAFTAIVCFVASGLIMVFKKKKNKDGGKVKAPWYVIALRILGSIATIPIVIAVGIVIYAVIASAIDKRTNLPRAVMANDYEQAEQILKNGADPDIRDKNGLTLLICVASHEDFVDVNNDTRYECSSNHFGYDDDEDDIKMMELLLEYGADINAGVTSCGDEDNHVFQEGGWHDIYANSDHYCGNTPLICAVRYRRPEVVEFLIDNGADVNQANDCGFTPILMCADTRNDNNGGIEIATMLLNEGADISAVSNFHQDILWLLMRRGTDDITEMKAVIGAGIE